MPGAACKSAVSTQGFPGVCHSGADQTGAVTIRTRVASDECLQNEMETNIFETEIVGLGFLKLD